MKQLTFFDNLREFIGGIAFSIFVWSLKMSAEEFWSSAEREAEYKYKDELRFFRNAFPNAAHNWQAAQQERALDKGQICPSCAGSGYNDTHVDGKTECGLCEGTGQI